jgi:hypothetical protein
MDGGPIGGRRASGPITALKNVPGVFAFTTYGVYEYYSSAAFWTRYSCSTASEMRATESTPS